MDRILRGTTVVYLRENMAESDQTPRSGTWLIGNVLAASGTFLVQARGFLW